MLLPSLPNTQARILMVASCFEQTKTGKINNLIFVLQSGASTNETLKSKFCKNRHVFLHV